MLHVESHRLSFKDSKVVSYVYIQIQDHSLDVTQNLINATHYFSDEIASLAVLRSSIH